MQVWIVLMQGKVLEIYEDPEDKVNYLLFGDKGTGFRSYEEARNAVRRTVRYRNRRWNNRRHFSDYDIVRIES